jgi:nitrile hydratase accessory protein
LSAPEVPEIGPLVRREGEPAFAEAWQAELLALAYALSEKGVFSPAEWSEALGAELRQAAARGEPDDQATYYRAALAALERLIERDGRITAEALAGRTEQWRRAYLNTPHGQPVELSAGANDASARLPHPHHP